MHLERLILILEIVGQRAGSSVADICKLSDLPKPTVYRLVQELVSAGLLEPVTKGAFVIGARLKRIAHSENSDQVLLEFIAPVLKQAATELGTAFFLSRLIGSSVEIIHVEIPDTGVSYLHPGLGKRPLHACSCSKAVVAFSQENMDLKAVEGRLKAYTEFTLTRVEDFHAELEEIRRRGYAECIEEIERGMCSVAAPLDTLGFGATMAIGTAGSVRVFTREFRADTGKKIMELARNLTTALDLAQSPTQNLAQG